MLPSVPSLSIFHKDDDESDHQGLDRTVTIGNVIEEGSTFSFVRKGSSMGLVEEEHEEGLTARSVGDEEVVGEKEPPASPPMYLAAGLGIGGGTWDEMLSGGELGVPEFDGVGDDEEDYYSRMVGEYPCHPVFLANYAQLLQSKGDFHGADEFYHRATLADPENGKIMLQHAKLVWEVHRDQHRALQIFKRAAQVAPDDSEILGAYASFVWEIDGDDDGEEDMPEQDQIQAGNGGTLSMYERSTSTDDFETFNQPTASVEPRDGNVEEYYKKMLEENPLNQSVLKNYARFLVQDRQRAEEYYARAVVADPKDGEIMSEYATMLWELHHDHEKASHFHEKAAESAPQNSYVLGSYASFLWETEDYEVDVTNHEQPLASSDHGSPAIHAST